MTSQLKVLLVDLNAFASFPTLAIGLLTAALRREGHAVQVICPLDHGRPTALRERRERITDHFKRRLHLSAYGPALPIRDLVRRARAFLRDKPDHLTIGRIRAAIQAKPDIILLSAYLMHYEAVREIAASAKQQGVPVVVGGPMFNIQATAAHWRKLTC